MLLGYVATWASDKEVPELKDSLETIRRTASDLISKIDWFSCRRHAYPCDGTRLQERLINGFDSLESARANYILCLEEFISNCRTALLAELGNY